MKKQGHCGIWGFKGFKIKEAFLFYLLGGKGRTEGLPLPKKIGTKPIECGFLGEKKGGDLGPFEHAE